MNFSRSTTQIHQFLQWLTASVAVRASSLSFLLIFSFSYRSLRLRVAEGLNTTEHGFCAGFRYRQTVVQSCGCIMPHVLGRCRTISQLLSALVFEMGSVANQRLTSDQLFTTDVLVLAFDSVPTVSRSRSDSQSGSYTLTRKDLLAIGPVRRPPRNKRAADVAGHAGDSDSLSRSDRLTPPTPERR